MKIINEVGLRDLKYPNEIHVFDNHCEMCMYAGLFEIPRKCIFEPDILDEVRQYKWGWSNSGYVFRERRYEKPRLYWVHHLVLPRIEGMMIDHIDEDQWNNRRSNLRYATNAQNQWNSSKRRGNTSIKGVHYYVPRNSYRGFIRYLGTAYQSKDFKTEEQAADWVQQKRSELHGDFANHGD